MRIKVSFDEVDSSLETKFIQTECTFNTGVLEDGDSFSISFGEAALIQINDIYKGRYRVTPRVYEQSLATTDKLMEQDVIVEVIPLAKTINTKNGYTVTIG